MGENFFQNAAQLGNFLYGATFFPLKCDAVALCRYFGGKNAAVVWWRNDLKGGASRGGELKKVACAQHCGVACISMFENIFAVYSYPLESL